MDAQVADSPQTRLDAAEAALERRCSEFRDAWAARDRHRQASVRLAFLALRMAIGAAAAARNAMRGVS